jgi:predicted nucleic acid-binding OB-fold protein
MLLTEIHLSRLNNLRMPQPDRLRKVKKSMGAIRHVLGERKRAKIAAFLEARQRLQDEATVAEGTEDTENQPQE